MKFLHFNRSLGYIIGTVLGICFLCASYFFIYLPGNEKLIEEQRFRTLQSIDRNIHEKVDNSVSLLNNIVSAKDINRETYARNYPTDKFKLVVGKTEPATNSDKRNNIPDSLVETIVNDSTNQVTIELKKRSETGSEILNGSLKFSVRQFVENLFPEDVFDEYIIFSNGKTVFESFPSGINILPEDSAYRIKKGLGGSIIRNVNSGGKEYKLFLHEVNLGGDSRWILGGLLSNSRYYKERSQLHAGIVMLLIILVLAMIVIFPWIKLYQMGGKDRLTLFDGASIILASMILMSLMSLCFFKYNTSIRKSTSNDSKKMLALQINTSFNNEIKKVLGVLMYYDTLMRENAIKNNIVNLNDSTISYSSAKSDKINKPKTVDRKLNSLLNNPGGYKNIKQVFWLDIDGKEVNNWTNESQNAPPSNFSSRNYFRSIKEGNPFYIDGSSLTPYFLDQVVSRTTGIFTSVISVKSRRPNAYLAATSFTMSSVENTILPSGYSFAIIDNNGKVLYHSKKKRNLNENVKAEFSDSANITNSINSRSTSEFITGYYSKSYSVLVTPMPDLPYSIIIFSDKSYQETRDVEVYSFTFSMLLLFFIFMVLQLGITFLVSARHSFFKKQLFDTSWIGPNKSRNKDYLLASAMNIVIIVVLTFYFPGATFLQFLFLLISQIIFISLFMNILLAIRYKKEGKNNNLKYKQYAIAWSGLLLAACIFVACNLLGDNRTSIILITLLSIFVGATLVFLAFILPEEITKYLSAKLKYTHSYTLMILTTLIIISGVPVAFFHISSYNYEQNLGIRYRQTDYANRLMTIANLDSILKEGTAACNENGIYYDGAYISQLPTFADQAEVNRAQDYLTPERRTSIQILGLFRLLINDKAVNTNKLSLVTDSGGSIIYYPGFFRAGISEDPHTYKQTAIKGKYLNLQSSELKYKMPVPSNNFFNFSLWILLGLGSLILYFFLIMNIVKKLFCLNLPNLEIWRDLDNKIVEDDQLNKLLFVIGLPGAGKKTDIIKKVKAGEIKYNGQKLIYDEEMQEDNNVLLADLISIPDKGAEIGADESWMEFIEETVNSKYKLIIFNHFEYNIQDDFTNRAKLDILERLMLKDSCKIIILSTIHPINFLDSLNAQDDVAVKSRKKTDDVNRSGHDLERWHVLLGHYRIVIMPIFQPEINHVNTASTESLLESETNHTKFLHDMQAVTMSIVQNNKVQNSESKTDELAYKLQISAHYFYMYIWQSLTKEEKFLLYDLAEDNLVNSYDDYNLTMLIAKGVISNKTGPLRFFNRGFKNFILTAIGNSEAMKIKERIRENGNWENLRIPLIIIIIAILAFLLISQQEAYTKLLTYIAALTAGVPVILKIFSLFDRSATKSGSGDA